MSFLTSRSLISKTSTKSSQVPTILQLQQLHEEHDTRKFPSVSHESIKHKYEFKKDKLFHSNIFKTSTKYHQEQQIPVNFQKMERLKPTSIVYDSKIIDMIGQIDSLSKTLKQKNLQYHEDRDTAISSLDTPRYSRTPRLNSMDEMVSEISSALEESFNESPTPYDVAGKYMSVTESENAKKISPFIKVILRETENILLFEKSSLTVPKGTEEADEIEKSNKEYEYLTVGKGRYRRRRNNEAQTHKTFQKTKSVNTDVVKKSDAEAYVSNYDMYDTYEGIQRTTKTIEVDGNKPIEITTYRVDDLKSFGETEKSKRFALASMLIQRLLAGNVFHEQQKRFRNMYLPDPLAIDIKYLYRLDTLWEYPPVEPSISVSCMCWCPSDGDILAVGYGLFYLESNNSNDGKTGYIAIWNIKNPVNPERMIQYNSPVSSIEFSHIIPQLIAVGLYDGTVEIRDISDENDSLVATNFASKLEGTDPVTTMKWIVDQYYKADEYKQILLTASTDGSIVRYHLLPGQHLQGYLHIKLNRIELQIEGIFVNRKKQFIEADRHPEIYNLILHPVQQDEFYALTDEGCYYKCSINHPQQHLDVLQLHQDSVLNMDWSPFSSKVFLTCGADWYIRIWISGIQEPVISLSSQTGPVNCAYWCPTHSFIIIAVTSKQVEVWDIRRNLIKPMSTHEFGKEVNINFTTIKFSKCGRSIAIGNTEGKIIMCALEDMPFPPHFQYNELEKAIYKATAAYPDLLKQVENIGNFGQ